MIHDLRVDNAAARGGTGLPYVIEPARLAAGAPQYVDRPDTLAGAVPRAAPGEILIRTADGDRFAAAGAGSFMSFTVERSSAVYIARDTALAAEPAWLAASFLDTGKQLAAMRAGRIEPYELYVNVYPAGARVRLGANLAAGVDARGEGGMYSVIVVPTPVDTLPPTAPLELHRSCATAAVVGLEWTASTDNVGLAGYRIVRDGAVIATVSPAETRYADTAVGGARRYTYAIAAFDGAGNATRSRPLRVRTSARARLGDPAYCPSATITSMRFRFASAYSETQGDKADAPPYSDGSDLWPLTWGADGDLYTFFGDGWGLCGQLDTGPASGADYTSFGFARISGPAPRAGGASCPSPRMQNLYGGYLSIRPYGGGKRGLLNGKAGAVIAVGDDFYAIGGIWRPGDPGGPTDSPNHSEIVYSLGNARSWQDAPWTFCRADAKGNPDPTGGLDGGLGVCPSGFVNFGPGYAGAADDYVYLYAQNNNPASWDHPGRDVMANATYLLRVPKDRLLDPTAYRYYAGLDARGEPIWSGRSSRRQPVFVDPAPPQADPHGFLFPMYIIVKEAVYDAPLGRYIATAHGEKVGQTAFYEAPHPWGPWSVIYYSNIDAARGGTGGWGNLGAGEWKTSRSRYLGADSLGAHIGNGWTSADGKTLWIAFSSDGKAPRNARLTRLAGHWMDSLNVVEAKLRTR